MAEVSVCAMLTDLGHSVGRCLARIADKSRATDEVGGAIGAEEESELGVLLSRLRSVADRSYCPPMQEAVQLQDFARYTWNRVAQHHELPSATSIVALLRELAVHTYLMGSSYFASLPVRQNYFQHNPVEAERCIVMCLRTAKDLSCTASPRLQEAESMLAYAADLYSLAGSLVSPKLHCTGLEIDFARLCVSWNSARYEQAVQLAHSLADQVATPHHPYREMLLQYIYATAERWPALAVAQTGGDGRGETSLQQLLALSLQIQKRERGAVDDRASSTAWRQPHCPLYGVTLLQYAASCLRNEAYAEVLQYGEAAFDELQSLEPLILQLKALAAMGRTQEALTLFCRILSDRAMDLQDLFSLAALMVDTAPALFVDIMAAVRARYPTKESDAGGMTLYDEFTFRYTCLLLHVGSAAAIEEMRSVLSGYSEAPRRVSAEAPTTPHARYYLCSLWQLAAGDGLPQTLRLDCLSTALTFASAATADEVDGMFVDLVDLTFQLIDACTEDAHATKAPLLLQRCLSCYEQYATSIRSVHGRRCHCQLVCCLASDEVVKEGAVAKLLSSFTQDSELVVACTTLVCFFVHHDALTLAAGIAKTMLTDVLADKLSATDALLFAKVYAMGVLSCQALPSTDSGVLLTAQLCPVLLQLPTEALPRAEWWWWCQFLWCVADTLAASTLRTALQLADAATRLAVTHKLAETPAQRAELERRVISVLECEFDCFAQGSAYLTCEAIRHYTGLAAQRGDDDDMASAAHEAQNSVSEAATVPVTLRLADVECQLRGLAEDASDGVSAKIDAVKVCVLDVCHLGEARVDDLEALAVSLLGVSARLQSGCLRQCASDAEVAALQRHLDRLSSAAASPPNAREVCEALLLCYKASHIACSTDGQREAYGALVRALELLFPSCGDEARGDVARVRPCDGEDATADVLQRAELLLEYFAVEAWNAAVQQNALHARAATVFWRDASLALCARLDTNHPARVAVTDLASRMPVL